eukprot:gb/GECG01008486.1/.p1 GENE.gb/GECG01008486.1/~~gb/GECG01008486.1/.p1  ORF type:complete len:223 (+),score=31.74 gb/GECG01008486.1/:1-669(+)
MAPKRSSTSASSSSRRSNEVHTESSEASQRPYALGALAQRFVEELQKSDHEDEDGNKVIDLSEAAQRIGVQKRRLYDITGVLEALGTISKSQQNKFKLNGGLPNEAGGRNRSQSTSNDEGSQYHLRQKIEEAKDTSNYLTDLIKKTSTDLHTISNQVAEDPYGWLTNRDIRELSCFDDHTLIAVRAPPGVTLEVPGTCLWCVSPRNINCELLDLFSYRNETN